MFALAQSLHISPLDLEAASLRQYQRWSAFAEALSDYAAYRARSAAQPGD